MRNRPFVEGKKMISWGVGILGPQFFWAKFLGNPKLVGQKSWMNVCSPQRGSIVARFHIRSQFFLKKYSP